jgi:hypothetical protein
MTATAKCQKLARDEPLWRRQPLWFMFSLPDNRQTARRQDAFGNW